MVTRYVITHVGKYGRTLIFPQQGRYTYATREEAARSLELFREGLRKVIGDGVSTLEVRECECWDGHFDPKGVWFDD